jgi:hypothetical protein
MTRIITGNQEKAAIKAEIAIFAAGQISKRIPPLIICMTQNEKLQTPFMTSVSLRS